MNYKQFENKVKSMSAHDIIMAMVEGLKNPKTKIDMNTYGAMIDGICFGCAATNAILHIIDANEDEVKSHVAYTEYDGSSLRSFEYVIDRLRSGRVEDYNKKRSTLWLRPNNAHSGARTAETRERLHRRTIARVCKIS